MAVDIAQLLAFSVKNNASDLHLSAGVPPMIRVDGDMKRVNMPALTHKEVHGMVYDIMNDKQRKTYEEFFETDFSFEIPKLARFRVNAFNQNRGAGAVFRNIPSNILNLDELAAPKIFRDLCMLPRGLVLVTGPTGSGKSTTLAAMIDLLNTTRRLNIISLEDPIEFVHRSKMSQVIQRELGTHIPSFAEGVRAAMREDPDVILVGELRDAETIRMAMTAAETGHLVLGTLHTTSAVKTIDRLIDALPAEEREQTKSFLGQSLLAVVTQILVRSADGRGRRAIVEVMITTKAVAKLIQSDQTHQIPSQLQMGRDFGMQLFDQALQQAMNERLIDPDDAYNYATDKKLFQKYVTDTSMLPRMDSASTGTSRAGAVATGAHRTGD
jgi:twitching motility protein PilT